MHVILLSGGSGKRLWPLSNESRSKQFLPLLPAPDGGRESMIQRVIRQLRESGINCGLTIATNEAQRDIILNQLGSQVNIVTEPERRDTFPAIALSCMYLALESGYGPNETVVVMPCDPFTSGGYFDAIARMAECVEKDVADLVLMGIRPTYPSAKYGYVVPSREIEGNWQRVQRFTEKPDVPTAEKLLAEGAYWNGGVFAFKLGYLTSLVENYIKAGSFAELRGRYTELPKISFDYEVAEKAKSVAVVAYDGEWKDLGTWNTLCEELPVAVTGNGVIGKFTHNTHIINELTIPIFCDGIDDVVIAASPDGILVSAKKASENIKNYVEQLTDMPLSDERKTH